MLNQVCTYIHNWFDADKQGRPYVRWDGIFTISDGALELPLLEGQHFRIVGSKLNDGIYQYPASDLMDETFNGEVRECVVPRQVLAIVKDVEAWTDTNADVLSSPYQSESFGGYSYTKSAGTSKADGLGDGLNWETKFGYRLTPWKKMHDGR